MIHNFPALVAFVRTNDEGLHEVKQLENAQKVLKHLLGESMSPRRLLTIIANSRFCNELFNFLLAHYRGTSAWSAFEDAVITSHDEWGRGGSCILSTSLAHFFCLVEDQEALIKRHRNILLAEDLPFLPAMDPDRHWGWRVQWYIARKNFLRAWDELKRAHRGLHISDTYTPTDFLRGDVRYAFRASRETVAHLASELFSVVAKDAGLVLDDESRTEYPFHSLRTPESAMSLLKSVAGPDSNWKVSKFGAQIALMARYFAGLEREKRRKKFVRKVRQGK